MDKKQKEIKMTKVTIELSDELHKMLISKQINIREEGKRKTPLAQIITNDLNKIYGVKNVKPKK